MQIARGRVIQIKGAKVNESSGMRKELGIYGKGQKDG